MSYFPFAIAFAGAVFYFKAAQFENRSPIPWVALSIAVSAVVIGVLEGRLLPLVLGQLALLPLIALWRVLREGDGSEQGDSR